MNRSIFSIAIASAFLVIVAGRVIRQTYIGCYIDYAGASRDLKGLSTITSIGGFSTTDSAVVSSNQMTHEFCSSICAIGSFRYFGIGLGTYCFCDNSYGHIGAGSEPDCASTCSGNPVQKCGGAFRSSIYAIEYPDNKTFTKTDRPNQTVVTTETTFWTVSARNDILCLAECEINANCSAVTFTEQQQLCHLLRFAYLPTNLSSTVGDFFMRG